MLQTGLTTIPVTTDQTIELENVTSVQIITGESNNQKVFINGVPLVDRLETILPADGTVCPSISMTIEFRDGLIPTSSPVCLIYLRIRKLLKCVNNGK
ncbi:hypothetical protein [Flavobacterium sp. GCM10023249]|uniref:hypothetical protein n=1 Tax=unclassified Flavobacterium TaxID=196869 RepID=UPI003621397A